VAKLYAHWITVNYRESYGLHASCGILFNHESPRRGETFVTRKITRAVGRIKLGMQKKLYLGNIDALRDWGFAGDYVDAMWRILNHSEPDDFVVATGEERSLQDFVVETFRQVDLDWEEHVESDPALFRPSDIERSCGNPSKAHKQLGWSATLRLPLIIKSLIGAAGPRE
jgi:GDPmannose 4,6-dehydratase